MKTITERRPTGRLAALLLVLALLAVLPLATAGADTTVSVARDTDVYSAASERTVVIAHLSAGSRVQVSSFDANWAEVALGNNTYGFVPTSTLNFGAPVPTAAPSFAPSPIATVTVASGPLNVHSAASLRTPVIAQLSTGQRVQLASYDSNWAEVMLGNGATGFVVTSYLNFGAAVPTPRPSAAATSHPKANTPGANATVATANHGPLHLRQNPSFDAGIVATYANGSRVQVMSQKGTWYYVRAGSQVGYMDTEFVTLDSGISVTGGEGYDAVVSNPLEGQVLHLRRHPSTDSDSLGTYHNGTYVEVLTVGTDWHQVVVEGISGYMDATYVTITTPNVTADRTVLNSEQGSVSLHAGPMESATVIAQLPNGGVVTVAVPDDEWTQVDVTIEGKVVSGYIQNEYLQRPDITVTEVG